MERKIRVMNYVEVMGELVDVQEDYRDFFDQYRRTHPDDRGRFVYNAVLHGEIADFQALTEKESRILGLPVGEYWFVCTYNHKYITNL